MGNNKLCLQHLEKKNWIKFIALSPKFTWGQWEKEAIALADCEKNISHNLMRAAVFKKGELITKVCNKCAD